MDVGRKICATQVAPGARGRVGLAGSTRKHGGGGYVCVEVGWLVRAALGATFASQNCNPFSHEQSRAGTVVVLLI